MLLSDPTPLLTSPVIPVVTIERAADAVPLARALLAGGLNVMEITLRTPAALDAVRAVIAEVADIIVGVGTVTRPLDVTHAVDAGADFLVSPGHAGRAGAGIGRCAGAGAARLRHRVGGDDARRAWLSGAEVFSGRAGGRHALAQGRGRAFARHQVLPDRRRERRQRRGLPRAANVLAVGGSWVAPAQAIAAGDFAGITARARAAAALRR